jgi:hypothetical protein
MSLPGKSPSRSLREKKTMHSPHGTQKFDRVTVTLVPTGDEKIFRNVPSTFSASHQSYEWRKAESLTYMIVPKKISGARIEIDVFVDPERTAKPLSKNVQRTVQDFVKSQIESQWKGLKLGSVGRPSAAAPPEKAFVRGSIEDILGVAIEN